MYSEFCEFVGSLIINMTVLICVDQCKVTIYYFYFDSVILTPYKHGHSQVVKNAILSLQKIYPQRNIPASQMRVNQLLSLLGEPAKIMNVPSTDMVGYIKALLVRPYRQL